MKLSIVLSLGVISFLTIVGCETPSEKTQRENDERMEQIKKDAEQSILDIEETIQNTNLNGDVLKDVLSAGGQPGKLKLSGALVLDESTLDPRLTIVQSPGRGWSGEYPEIDMDSLILETKVNETLLMETQVLEAEKTFINVGCDTAEFTEVADLQEKAIETKEIEEYGSPTLAKLRANLIIICDAAPLTDLKVSILADKLILKKMNLTISGDLLKSVQITTNELELRSANLITTLAQDKELTVLAAPSVTIAATTLTGEGSLIIESHGANYLAP